MNFIQRIRKRLESFCKLMNFMCFISYEDIFGKGNPELIFKVLDKFIELEHSNYPDIIKMNRNVSGSYELFRNLINSYLTTKSDVTLEQILTVLKEEFIKRENKNGRKQFQSR